MRSFIAPARDSKFPTFFTPENIKLAESLGPVKWNESDVQYTAADVARLIGDSEVYVTAWDCPALDANIIANAPSLKLMVHLCGTVTPYVKEDAWGKGVRIISGNDYFAESVAEGTIGYMLTALRDIPKYSRRFKEEQIWRLGDEFTNSLIGKTVGIVSYGAIAKHLVRMLQPFRVKIKVYDIKTLPTEDVLKYGLEQVSLEEIFSNCQIVSLHTPLIDATRHMIDERLLRMLPEGALFVNTARGAVVDEQALGKELIRGRFRAILDVYEEEPPRPDSLLYKAENVILVPHMGGPTFNLRADITRDLLLESAAFLKGEGGLPHEISHTVASTMSIS